MKLLQKTIISKDSVELDSLCNEFRNKFKVNFSQSGITTSTSQDGSYDIILSSTMFYEVQQ